MGADHPPSAFVPRHGVHVGTVAASRGRALHAVAEIYRGAAMTTIFAEFPPNAQLGYETSMVRIVATFGAAGARELAALLVRAADAAEAAVPQRPSRAPGEQGGHRG